MQMLQEKIEGRFFWEMKGKVQYYYCSAFLIYYDILQPEVFCDAQNAPNFFSAGAVPRTPLGKLTTLPQTSGQLKRGIPSLFPHSQPHRRLRRLTLS